MIKFLQRRNCEIRCLPFKKCLGHIARFVTTEDFETGLGCFDVMFCKRCHLGFTEKYPSSKTFKHLYSGRRTGDFDIITESPIDKIKDYFGTVLIRKLTQSRTCNNILDYATGNGRFALNAAAVLPLADITAFDFQREPPPRLENRKCRRLKYICDPRKLIKGKYDLIILRHVLEHSQHPMRMLKDLRSLLSKTGILYIEVPNLYAGCARLFKARWKGFYVPRHTFHFTKQSLQEVIEKAGMSCKAGFNEMPLMGNTIAIFTGLPKTSLIIQVLGIILHPIQILIGILSGNPTCLNAVCSRARRKC